VTLAAAELQAQQLPPHWQQQQQQQQALAEDPQARLMQLQAECQALQARLSSAEGSNKLLKSNVDHKERELAALRQQLKQQQQQGGGGAGSGGGGAGSAGGGRGGLQHSAFAVGDMTKQLDSLRQQLLFKEQEVGASPAGWASSLLKLYF
jgi:DNA-directed RNA polymerase specialized sigma54-like protein